MTHPKATPELLHGTLDVLILRTLSYGPRHGYGVARWLEAQGDEALRVEEGSLYPALYRMERRGWIRAEWGRTEVGRRAKFYSLTPSGVAQLEEQIRLWSAFSSAVSRILVDTPPPRGG